MVTRSKSGIVKPKHPFSLIATTPDLLSQEPRSYIQALKHPVWKQAMKAEVDALLSQATWTLVPYPSNANIIGCQWIFRI